MFGKFLPTHIYNNIYEIKPEDLKAQGIRALVLDIDNTLVTYDDPKPTESVAAWLDAMHAAGIQTAFVSNNHAPRVETFCEGMGCYHHADSHKPSVTYLCEAMKHMGSDASCTACVGDQIFTDIFAGRSCGMRAFLVPPIKDLKIFHMRLKRVLEKPIIWFYYRKTEKKK